MSWCRVTVNARLSANSFYTGSVTVEPEVRSQLVKRYASSLMWAMPLQRPQQLMQQY